MKPICVIQGPYATRSGYGDMTRDIIRHIIELDRYDVVLVSMPWGACPLNALNPNNPKDLPLIQRTAPVPVQLTRKPELFIQVSVPNEFQPMGQYNIGITAGIETTLCSAPWIEGCNRMDVIFTISEHSKRVLEGTELNGRDPQGNIVQTLKITKPIEVLHNCVDTNIFKKIEAKEIPSDIKEKLDSIPEAFNFLFVGHWLQGNVGEDRKNVGLLVYTFCKAYSERSGVRPGLILKTSGAGFSIMDQEDIVRKIESIKRAIGPNCPNVYVLHGELTEEEMNGLYNHPKVKAHITFTKGEGFGRPLLEASMSYKPILASGWSGHLDFLNAEDALLLNGELKNVDQSVVWENVILKESQWFNVDPQNAAKAMDYTVRNYGKLLDGAYRLATKNRENFGYEKIREKTAALLDKYVPRFALPVPIKLPSLKKVGA